MEALALEKKFCDGKRETYELAADFMTSSWKLFYAASTSISCASSAIATIRFCVA